MKQTISTVKKTTTLTAVYYKTAQGILMDNAGDLTLIFGDDGLCGVTSLEAGLQAIGWDKTAPVAFESISWI